MSNTTEKVQIKEQDLEQALGEVTYKGGKPADADADNHEGNGGYIEKKHQGLVLTVMIGFAVCFLGDFCASLAKDAYDASLIPPTTEVTNNDYHLMWVLNLTHAAMFVLCCICLLAPRFTKLDTLFIDLFWDRKQNDVPADGPGKFFERQMGAAYLAICIAQFVQPSNTGVTVVALLVNICTVGNFLAAAVFDHYRGLINRNLMWSGFVIAPIVFIGAFTHSLNKVQFFNRNTSHWKNDAAGDDQGLLWYVTVIHGLCYLPIAAMNLYPAGEKFFMSFFFEEFPAKDRSPTSWVMKNVALIFTAISIACVTFPSNPGVGVVIFFVNVMMLPLFIMATFGMVTGMKNRMLWGMFMVNTVVFIVLIAVGLNKLTPTFNYDNYPWDVSSHNTTTP